MIAGFITLIQYRLKVVIPAKCAWQKRPEAPLGPRLALPRDTPFASVVRSRTFFILPRLDPLARQESPVLLRALRF
jgi:hypothetical protein